MARGSTATESEETTEEAPATEEVKVPQWRYFSVSLEIQASSMDENISAEQVEEALKDQVVLPSAVHIQGIGHVNIVGATSGGASESSSPTEINSGYGREVPPKEE